MVAQQQVFWSGADPTAGVIAASFRDAYVRAGQVERPKISQAADDWWRACGVVHRKVGAGGMQPVTCAAIAVRSAALHDVEREFQVGLIGQLGEEGAEAATATAEEGWGDWARRKAQEMGEYLPISPATVQQRAQEAGTYAGQKASETATYAGQKADELIVTPSEAYEDLKAGLKRTEDEALKTLKDTGKETSEDLFEKLKVPLLIAGLGLLAVAVVMASK